MFEFIAFLITLTFFFAIGVVHQFLNRDEDSSKMIYYMIFLINFVISVLYFS